MYTARQPTCHGSTSASIPPGGMAGRNQVGERERTPGPLSPLTASVRHSRQGATPTDTLPVLFREFPAATQGNDQPPVCHANQAAQTHVVQHSCPSLMNNANRDYDAVQSPDDWCVPECSGEGLRATANGSVIHACSGSDISIQNK